MNLLAQGQLDFSVYNQSLQVRIHVTVILPQDEWLKQSYNCTCTIKNLSLLFWSTHTCIWHAFQKNSIHIQFCLYMYMAT